MRSVLCSIASSGERGRVHIPVGVFIPEVEWGALAERLSREPIATDYPALAALTASVLPKVAALSDLPPLREELARVAPGLLEGPAASAAALLCGYLDRAAQCVAAGGPTRLTAAFQLLDGGRTVRSEPRVDNVPRADATSRGYGNKSYDLADLALWARNMPVLRYGDGNVNAPRIDQGDDEWHWSQPPGSRGDERPED